MAKLIVAMTEYGESPAGVSTTYRVFEQHEGLYYPIDEIEEIIDDDTKDEVVIAGEIGKKKYNRNIPIKKAAIHYLVSCTLKRKKK